MLFSEWAIELFTRMLIMDGFVFHHASFILLSVPVFLSGVFVIVY